MSLQIGYDDTRMQRERDNTRHTVQPSCQIFCEQYVGQFTLRIRTEGGVILCGVDVIEVDSALVYIRVSNLRS